MAINSLEAELEAVNNAIEAILNGAQSYQINNQSVTRANLKDLYDRKDTLESRLASRQRARNGRSFVKKPVFGDW